MVDNRNFNAAGYRTQSGLGNDNSKKVLGINSSGHDAEVRDLLTNRNIPAEGFDPAEQEEVNDPLAAQKGEYSKARVDFSSVHPDDLADPNGLTEDDLISRIDGDHIEK